MRAAAITHERRSSEDEHPWWLPSAALPSATTDRATLRRNQRPQSQMAGCENFPYCYQDPTRARGQSCQQALLYGHTPQPVDVALLEITKALNHRAFFNDERVIQAIGIHANCLWDTWSLDPGRPGSEHCDSRGRCPVRGTVGSELSNSGHFTHK